MLNLCVEMVEVYVIAANEGVSIREIKLYENEGCVLYFGPPPPSGTVQVISWVGTLMSQSLQ